MGAITCYARTSQIPSVSSILIYAYCEDILSNKQLRMNLNPISIKLEQVSNFPDDVAIENDFSYIYAKIFFVDRVITTPYYIPARTIYFEFVKCYLREVFQAEDLINFLGTKFLTVEVIWIYLNTFLRIIYTGHWRPIGELIIFIHIIDCLLIVGRVTIYLRKILFFDHSFTNVILKGGDNFVTLCKGMRNSRIFLW